MKRRGEAKYNEYVDIIKRLLTCPTVNPADVANEIQNSLNPDCEYAMKYAIKLAAYPIIVLLLQHPRVRVEFKHIKAAIDRGDDNILELFLTRPELWPDIRGDRGIKVLLQRAKYADYNSKKMFHMLSTYRDIQLAST